MRFPSDGTFLTPDRFRSTETSSQIPHICHPLPGPVQYQSPDAVPNYSSGLAKRT